MKYAFICDAVRTPIGRYGGALASVRADDLGAIPLRALQERNPSVDWDALDDVYIGCANQAGEDNRNVARMSALLAGLPVSSGAVTINRLCGSGMDAVAMAARSIVAREAELVMAGGVESMSRAPFVLGKAGTAYDRNVGMFDTTIGWRFVNPQMKAKFGTDTMPETAENIAKKFGISRQDQDLFAFNSQAKTALALASGRFINEIVPVEIPQEKGKTTLISEDEHPRASTLDSLARLRPIVRHDGTVTAGNASGVNDGAACLIVASEDAVNFHGLKPRARILGCAVAGVAPHVMGIGPVPATLKLLNRLNMSLHQFDIFEINEAFAAQSLAVLRELGLPDDAENVNPNGGAIALGHPLGMSGGRLVLTVIEELHRTGSHRALATMCIGVGQGIAIALERA